MILRRIARPLLASAFIASGVQAVRTPASIAASAEPVLDKGREALPAEVSQRIPQNTETLVRVNGIVQIGGGLALATGRAPRLASTVLAGSLVPTTFAGTDFWNEPDPARRVEQRNAFIKNLGLLGGILLAAADTEGKPSLAWRGRHKADAAGHAIAERTHALTDALPSFDHGSSTMESFVERGRHEAAHLGERSAEVAGSLTDSIREHAPAFADTARERSGEFAEAALDRSTELADAASKQSRRLAKKLRKKAPVIAEAARERSHEIADRGHDLADRLNERGHDFADKAGARAPELAGQARYYTALAEEKAKETADEGRRRLRKARS